MSNLPKWEFKHYFADIWELTRDGEQVGTAYKPVEGKEAFILYDKRVPKKEFDELLKGIGMIVDWRYDSVSKKYQAVVNWVD